MTDEKNPLGMTSLQQSQKESYGEKFKHLFTYDWIFSSWFEKTVVAGSILFSLYSIFKFLWAFLT